MYFEIKLAKYLQYVAYGAVQKSNDRWSYI